MHKHVARAVKFLRDPKALPLVSQLVEAIDASRSDLGDALTASEATQLVEDLRRLSGGDSPTGTPEPLKAILRAVDALARDRSTLAAEQLRPCRKAALQLMFLFLVEHAARLHPEANQRVGRRLFAGADDRLCAALIAEACTGTELSLEFVPRREDPIGAWRLPHYLDPDELGVLPGRAGDEIKREVEATLDGLAHRVRRWTTPHSASNVEAPAVTASLSDEDLSAELMFVVDALGIHPRLVIDLSKPGAVETLRIAQTVNERVGIVVVAHRPGADAPAGFDFGGDAKPGVGRMDRLVLHILSRLHLLEN